MLLTRKVCGGCVAVLKQHLREFVEPQLHVPPFLERRVRRLEAVPLRIPRRQHRLHRRGKAREREGARRVVHLFVVELKGFRHPARRRTRRKRSRVIGRMRRAISSHTESREPRAAPALSHRLMMLRPRSSLSWIAGLGIAVIGTHAATGRARWFG